MHFSKVQVLFEYSETHLLMIDYPADVSDGEIDDRLT